MPVKLLPSFYNHINEVNKYIMPYITEIQTIEAARTSHGAEFNSAPVSSGIPTTEYRTQPEVTEQRLITIEFTPPATNDEYLVEQPEFVFGDIVIIKQQWEDYFLNRMDTDELDTFQVCAMELIEPKNPSGQPIDYPYWQYGIRCTEGTRELMWFKENELVRKASTTLDSNTVVDWF